MCETESELENELTEDLNELAIKWFKYAKSDYEDLESFDSVKKDFINDITAISQEIDFKIIHLQFS